ncbi:MurR/RpiR family transcriptional regulator [Propionispora vibrioides]|uniref:DNA-binding transcriptional regulator, MurR/RpiR family, contains HTH and SIS domains n=1 Tax=Propionispora vibrioides TaxID=112903 RepID=A0A1H8U9I1_9FIRM|nr:MurR/RpiR family transcriptional regulator [Propionispora vibrioides]SEO99890.1 DNA-binding transcriptional regulator, MurR/RpiR family, contains HTH and SIS domains [Propionispora vibrioides]
MDRDQNPNACLSTIQSMFQTLTKTEKKLAEYILNNPAEVVHLTITELADRCVTAEATITRLCKKLNYSGFQSLKISLATDIYQPFESVYNEVNVDDPLQTVIGKIFQNINEGLQDTLKLLHTEALDRAISAVLSARRIDVYGSGGSAVIAADVEHRFSRFGIPVRAYADQHMQASSAALLHRHDVVIAISHTGSNRDVIQAVKIAKDNEATIIALTSHLRSPLGQIADIVLQGMAREVNYRTEAMSSRLVHLAILDVLYVGAMLRQPDRITDNMQKIRQAIASRRL